MKTIESRALETYPKGVGLFTSEGAELLQRAYIHGATEQKTIDIEKACAWLIEHLDDYVGEGGWMCSDPYGDCDTYAEIVAKDFRKAMEE